jgi:hypothetical protein
MHMFAFPFALAFALAVAFLPGAFESGFALFRHHAD